jgi:hypothetical protein
MKILWCCFSPALQRTIEYASFRPSEVNRARKVSVAASGKAPDEMISALKKLSVDNLSNLTPHPLKVFLQYSNPPVLERIKALRKF